MGGGFTMPTVGMLVVHPIANLQGQISHVKQMISKIHAHPEDKYAMFWS